MHLASDEGRTIVDDDRPESGARARGLAERASVRRTTSSAAARCTVFRPVPSRVPLLAALALPLMLLLTACPATETVPDEPVPSEEAYAPGRDGEVRTSQVILPGETEPTTLTYEVIDGLAIYPVSYTHLTLPTKRIV